MKATSPHGRSDKAAAYVAAFATSRHPVPYNLRSTAIALAAIADELIQRGWNLRGVDTDGMSLSWPPSTLAMNGFHADTESVITWITLTGARTAEYTPAGSPRGTRATPIQWGSLAELVGFLTHLEQPAQ